MQTTTRAYQESDKAFIYSTWLRGLFYSNEFYNQIAKHVFFAKYAAVIDALIARSNVNIACDAEDNDVILAYTISEPGVLHWAYTKPAFRQKGLVSALVGTNKPTSCTHLTHMVQDLRQLKGLEFNPFLIGEPQHGNQITRRPIPRIRT